MTQREIDELRSRINLDAIDSKERKKLFDQFYEHGGDIKITGELPDDKIRGGGYVGSALEQRRQKYLAEVRKKQQSELEEDEKLIHERASSRGKKKRQESIINKFKLNLRGLFNRVLTFSGGYTPDFMGLIRNKVQVHLINLFFVTQLILHPKNGGYPAFKKEALERSPHNFEIILRLAQLYDEGTLNSILEKEAALAGKKLHPLYFKNSLTALFKHFYILDGEYKTLSNALIFGLNVRNTLDNLSRKELDEPLDKANEAINYLFYVFYPKLVLAFGALIERDINPKSHNTIRPYLKLTSEEKFGAYKETEVLKQVEKRLNLVYTFSSAELENEEHSDEEHDESNDLEASQNTSLESTESEEPQEVSEELQLGQELYQKIDWTKINPELDSKDEVHKIWVILEFFEQELSFILTSKKIELQPYYDDNRQKTDYRIKLQDAYVTLNHSFEIIKDYIHQIQQYYETESNNDLPIKTRQLKLDDTKKKIQTTHAAVRKNAISGFSALAESLSTLLEHQDEVLTAAQGRIHFERYDAQRLLKGKSQLQAMKILYSFSLYIQTVIENSSYEKI